MNIKTRIKIRYTWGTVLLQQYYARAVYFNETVVKRGNKQPTGMCSWCFFAPISSDADHQLVAANRFSVTASSEIVVIRCHEIDGTRK